MNDKEIVEAFFQRQEDAMNEARRNYEKYCMYVARNVLFDGRDAEECVNDAFLSAWNSIPPNRPENLKTYLAKLVRDAAVDFLRRSDREKRRADGGVSSLEELGEVSGHEGTDDMFREKELAKLISDYLGTLPESDRKVFVRRYWYCDSIAEICRIYGMPESRVKRALKRTKDGLAEFLRKEGYYI